MTIGEADFDYVLENRGYEIQHTTNVMAADLEHADLSASYDLVTLTDDIPDIWIESLFRFKGNHKSGSPAVVPSMYHAIVKDTICASIWNNGKSIATGLGILDR